MSEEQKTHAEIIEEMHEYAEETDFCAHGNQSIRERIEWMADRLEAAHKREIDSLTALIERLCEGLDNVYEREGIDYGSGEAYDDAKKYLAGLLENTQAEGGVAK